MARRYPRQSTRRNPQNNDFTGQMAAQIPTKPAVMPTNPTHFLNRFPTYGDYTSHMAGRPYATPITAAQYGGLSPVPHGGGQGGGGSGGGTRPERPGPPWPAQNPTPGTTPTTGASPTGFSPTLGNNYGGSFQSYNNTTPWPTYSGPQPQGIAMGTFMNPEAKDTERFTYDTFANGQTYKPMPGGLTSQPGNSYPYSGYAPPPSNTSWYNPGVGGATPAGYQPMSWDQYATAMAGMSNDIQPYFKQSTAPVNAQNVWWANPVITDPGYYDPWTEARNLQSHFGQATGGSLAQAQALGLTNGVQGQLDYYRYLAHQAGIPGYAGLTGPLPVGYHSPNIGGTYGA